MGVKEIISDTEVMPSTSFDNFRVKSLIFLKKHAGIILEISRFFRICNIFGNEKINIELLSFQNCST